MGCTELKGTRAAAELLHADSSRLMHQADDLPAARSAGQALQVNSSRLMHKQKTCRQQGEYRTDIASMNQREYAQHWVDYQKTDHIPEKKT